MNKKSNKFRRVPLALTLGTATFALAAAALMTRGAVGVSAAETLKFYPAFNNLQQVVEAAGQLNEQLAEEGMVLLKNDGKLPLKRGSWVSVFGAHASGLNHGWTGKADLPDAITTVPQSLEAAGFHVNPTLNAYYEKNGASGRGGAMSSSYFDVEPVTFGGVEKASYQTYGDAAVIVLARNGGEGSDIDLIVKSEEVNELDKGKYGQEHKALYSETTKDPVTGEDVVKTYHHALMLTKSEHELINHVKANFKKICVVINSSNAMELGELKDDPAINAMIWMGAPGETGAAALGRIISGEVNPSGRLVDEFPRDFTADPTWVNFGSQAQVGNTNHSFDENGETYYIDDPVLGKSGDATFTHTDYEEDIYLGYRFYETYYEDLYQKATNDNERDAATKWYNDHVAFAFGEGLSYSKFKFKILELKTDAAEDASALTAADLNSAKGAPAKVKKLYAKVRVTNVGDYAGKETVQIYVKAPYKAGEIEKSVHDIVGFGKTDVLAPGASEEVVVEFNVQDFASWDARDLNNDTHKGDYELDAGEYTVRATSSSHVDLEAIKDEANRLEYDEAKFNLDNNAHLHLDDFSGAELHNLFTTDNGKYKDTGFDGRDIYNSERTADMMLNGEDAMTKLSRADFDGTMPEKVKGRVIAGVEGAPDINVNGLTFVQEVYDRWEATRTPRKDYHPEKQVDAGSTMDKYIRKYQELTDNPTDPWYISEEDLATKMANWTQAKNSGENITIKFKDMRGVEWDDPRWDTFLNQLTYDELISLFCDSRASTPAIKSIGKSKSIDEDGPNNYENLFEWVDEPTIAATFNQELAEKEGQIVGDMAILNGRTGWYGPGMDMHHTAFSGRNNEYYSQDGLQGGYIAAAVVRGAQSKGLNAMIKHLAFNDQDTNRGGQSNMVWTTEQNIRQYEIKMFQMAIQEGGAGAGMSGYGRVCGIVNQSNYRLNHNLLQDEWGWKGFMITDGFLGMRWCTTLDIMIRCGYQIQYKTEGAGYDWVSGEWRFDAEKDLRGGKGNVFVPDEYEGDESTWYDPETGIPQSVKVKTWKPCTLQYYYSRETAKSVLYSTVNSINYENGYTELDFEGKDERGSITLPSAKVGVNFEHVLGLEIDADSSVVYTLGEGAPDGLSIDGTGKLSGKPKAAGNFSFTITALIDGWISKSVKANMVVESAFFFDADGDDLTALKVNDEVFAQIKSDVFNTQEGYSSVKYSIQSGKLPAGLALAEDGTITGTVTEAGEFHVVAKIEASKSSGGGGFNPFGLSPKQGAGGPGGGGGTTTETQTFAFDVIVTGEPQPQGPTLEERVAALEENIETLEGQIETVAAAILAGDTELASAIESLKTQIEALAALGADVSDLKTALANLEAKVAELEKNASSSSASSESSSSSSKSGGCGGSIVGGSVVVSLALASVAAILIHKKNKED
ncbi:MAG: glycoside hydrolase family 3 C-terminal domain-containing protein [Bacilli bacterium]|nr:glycoside hydrolase family 3 C-terminal domain-containing protein [Bacilli bacterium]